MKWTEIKKSGSEHYKTGDVEPIDLYKQGEMLQDFAVASIMKYAYRNRRSEGKEISIKDMNKIKHYAEMMICLSEEAQSK